MKKSKIQVRLGKAKSRRLIEMGLDNLWLAALDGDKAAILRLKQLVSSSPDVRQALASIFSRRKKVSSQPDSQRGSWASLSINSVGWISYVQGGLPSLSKRK